MALAQGESSHNTRASRILRKHILAVETQSMFKKLVPVIALALIAGPAFAQSTSPAPASSTPAASSSASDASKSSTHKKKHHKKSGEQKPADSTSSAPPK
jgi:hypothetical protein